MRERNEEIKRLKKEVEQLKGTKAQSTLGTPPTELAVNASPSLAHSGTEADPDGAHPAASAISLSEWIGDDFGMLPQAPGSEHDSFAGLSQHDGQGETWGSVFSSVGVTPDALLQPAMEHGLGHAITVDETTGSVSVSCCSQQHGEACNNGSGGSSSTASQGSYRAFTFLPGSFGPGVMSHTRSHTTGAGDSTPSKPPTLRPFTFSNSTQGLRTATSRLDTCGSKDIYHDGNSYGKASPFSSHTRLQMETGTRHSFNGACPPVSSSSHHSPMSSPWCACKPSGSSHAPVAADLSIREARHIGNELEYERQIAIIRPPDMNSTYTHWHFPHQGLVVEPSDYGDGVTIRVQPNATSGLAGLVAFMIQQVPAPNGATSNNQPYELDYDGINHG